MQTDTDTERAKPTRKSLPMYGVLWNHETRCTTADEERGDAVAVVLNNGLRYNNVTIWDFLEGGRVVELHDLNDRGRRVFVSIDQITAVEGHLQY